MPPPIGQPQQQRQRRTRVVGGITVGTCGGDQLIDGCRSEAADAEVIELPVGRHHRDVGLLVPQRQRREQPGVLVQAGVEGGLVGHGQRSVQCHPHDRAFLVGQAVEVDVEVGHIAVAVHRTAQRHEPPATHLVRLHLDRVRGVVLVHLDDQHVPGIGFDVVIVGDLR